MQVSKRLRGINGTGGSDGWGLFYEARALQASGVPITDLTIGEHDIRTDPNILDAMHQSAVGGHTGYASVPGILELRETVARRITDRTGVRAGPENIAITAGGQAALFAAHLAACDPGDRALFIDPYYATYPSTLRAAGLTPVPVRTRPEDGFQPRADAIDASAKGARSILVNTPNNPTGGVYSRETMEGIARAAEAHDLWVVSDEVYEAAARSYEARSGGYPLRADIEGAAKHTVVPTRLVQARKDPNTNMAFVAELFENIPVEKEMYWLEEPTHRFDGYNWFADNPRDMLDWFDAHLR